VQLKSAENAAATPLSVLYFFVFSEENYYSTQRRLKWKSNMRLDKYPGWAGEGDSPADRQFPWEEGPSRMLLPHPKRQTLLEFLHRFEVLVSSKSDWTFPDRDNIWPSFVSHHMLA